jgi:hypothetical protein
MAGQVVACPHCGLETALFIPKAKDTKTAPQSASIFFRLKGFCAAILLRNKKNRNTSLPKQTSREVIFYLLGVFVLGLLLGYFAGREHIKYELRSAVKDAFGGLQDSFGSEATKQKTKKILQNQTSSPIKVTLTKKGFHAEDFEKNITFSLSFLNQTGKNIRAFDGVLTFTDLLGNEIMSSKLEINEAVSLGEILNWDGVINYNQFMSEHKKLRSEKIENIKTIFMPRQVLFDDGSVKEFEQ